MCEEAAWAQDQGHQCPGNKGDQRCHQQSPSWRTCRNRSCLLQLVGHRLLRSAQTKVSTFSSTLMICTALPGLSWPPSNYRVQKSDQCWQRFLYPTPSKNAQSMQLAGSAFHMNSACAVESAVPSSMLLRSRQCILNEEITY